MNSKSINLKQLFKDKRVRIQAFIALLILAIGFVLSIAGFVELQDIAKQRLYLQTQHHTEAQLKQVQTNIDISLDSLIEIAGLYYATGDVSQSQLASYIASDTKYHSGTVALGWVPKVMAKDIVAFETEMQQRDSDFHVYEVTGHGMPTFVRQGKDAFPIKAIISPNNGSLKAGFNLASIASRKRTMKKAERIQATAVTPRISLFSGSQQFYGFQALHPVFDRNELGQDLLAGFVMGNYGIKALIEDVFLDDSEQLDIALYDANTSSQQLLYSSTERLTTVDDVRNQNQPHWTYPLTVADQQWLMAVFPNTSALTNNASWLPYTGLIAGGLITLLLTLYLFVSLIRTRQLAQLSIDLAGTETQLNIQTQLKKEADKANQAKSGLLTAASHDLRQPLHTIGLLTTLLKDSKHKTERTKLIDNILAAVDGMNTMFISLLDISLLESNQLPIKKDHFYLQDVLDKLVVDFSAQAKEKGLTFSHVETSVCVVTDQALLGRILLNLLSNAFRYTPNGKILLGCRRLKNHIRICVLDTGIGLSEEAIDHIFVSFYREKQAKQLTDKGLGLGLAIVQEASSLLGLNMGMQSQLEKGSVFYVDVPYGDPALIGEVQVVKHQSSVNKLIWVIEDDETIRFALEKVLQSWQCRIESLVSGKETQILLAKNTEMPDVIIADYQLINETGLELVLQIREHYQHTIPAIIITGTVDLKVRELVEQAGCQFMTKPVKPDALNLILHQIEDI
ncbi:MAG: CHASE domain-containing protein [Piscirickettsiaceae bacterium]|nr:CHASE domain-containing protein [Piscirickettsiaceae bacterium]